MLRIVANEAKNHLRGRDRRRRRDERYGSWVVAAAHDPEAGALDATTLVGWRWPSVASDREIGKCSPTGTSPDCRRSRRQLPSVLPLAR